MRIYRPRGVTKGQLVLVTVLGVFGGIYIWKPLFEEHFPRQRRKPLENIEEVTTNNTE